MVTKDGLVKILDFGLAKLAAPARERRLAAGDARRTRRRARGRSWARSATCRRSRRAARPVDFRSDQFALGSILYEMATGQRAFQKKTAVETLSAIIREDPEPIAAASPQAPAPLRWIVERCLAKEPENRYASTRDLARDLKQTLDHLSEASTPPRSRPCRSGARAGSRGGRPSRPRSPCSPPTSCCVRAPPAVPRRRASPRLTRLTFAPGLEDEPALSPDGKFLAYTTDERGNLDVVVLPLGGGETIRVAAGDADEAQPAWSPDGSKLAFVSARDHGGRLGIALNSGNSEPYLNMSGGDIFLVTALGGEPVKLVESGYNPAWSPDGGGSSTRRSSTVSWDLWTVPVRGRSADEADPRQRHGLSAELVSGRQSGSPTCPGLPTGPSTFAPSRRPAAQRSP